MDIKTFDKAYAILKAIDQLNAEKERFSHIMNKDVFDFFIEDRCTGDSYRFSQDLLPEDFYKFIGFVSTCA